MEIKLGQCRNCWIEGHIIFMRIQGDTVRCPRCGWSRKLSIMSLEKWQDFIPVITKKHPWYKDLEILRKEVVRRKKLGLDTDNLIGVV